MILILREKDITLEKLLAENPGYMDTRGLILFEVLVYHGNSTRHHVTDFPLASNPLAFCVIDNLHYEETNFVPYIMCNLLNSICLTICSRFTKFDGALILMTF